MEIHYELDFRTILAFITTTVTVLSYFRNEKFKKQAIAQLWSLFQKQQNGYKITQSALSQYKSKYEDNPDTDLLCSLSRTEAFDQTIFEDIILQIVLTDDKLTNENIDTYRGQNRISDYDAILFKSMLNKSKITFFDRIKGYF